MGLVGEGRLGRAACGLAARFALRATMAFRSDILALFLPILPCALGQDNFAVAGDDEQAV